MRASSIAVRGIALVVAVGGGAFLWSVADQARQTAEDARKTAEEARATAEIARHETAGLSARVPQPVHLNGRSGLLVFSQEESDRWAAMSKAREALLRASVF